MTTQGQWNTAIMGVGDTVVVDYKQLENSSFSGYQLKGVRYTYKLLSTSHYSGKVVFQAISDPTLTSYTHVYNADDQTTSGFEMEMTVQFFDANGNEIMPTKEQYALASFASLNSVNGQGEYVKDYNGRFVPINGSTITVQDNRAMNYSTTSQESLSSDWDSEKSADAYIGAIVGVSEETIRFTFGITDGFADWFAFNSDVKVKGGVLATPPKAPIAPAFMAKPVAPEEVAQPSPILTPIVFFHKNRYVPTPPPKVKPQLEPAIKTFIPSLANKAKAKLYQRIHSTAQRPRVLYNYTRPSVLQAGQGYYNTRQAYLPARPSYAYRQPSTYYSSQSYTTTQTPRKLVVRYTLPAPTVSQAVRREAGKKIEQLKGKNIKSNTKTDWFAKNTGLSHQETKDVLDYVNKTGKAAKKVHRKDRASYNRDVAQGIAFDSYHDDTLQMLFNGFGTQPIGGKHEARTILDKTHGESIFPIDLPHVMTTLASLEEQKSDTISNKIGSLGGFQVLKLLSSSFPNGKVSQRNILLQQNSLVGDMFTFANKKDMLSDMDAIILARHPKFKDMPMDKRFVAYYSQPNLDKKRHKLLYEIYDKNDKKAKEKLANEILAVSMSLGGNALAVYGAFQVGKKGIRKNKELLSEVVFGEKGYYQKFEKKEKLQRADSRFLPPIGKEVQARLAKQGIAPLTSLKKSVSTTIIKAKTLAKKAINNVAQPIKNAGKAISKGVKNIGKAVNKHVVKPISKAVNKHVVKPIAKTFNKVFKPTPKKIAPARRINQHPRRPAPRAIPKMIHKAKRTMAKAFKPANRPIARKPSYNTPKPKPSKRKRR